LLRDLRCGSRRGGAGLWRWRGWRGAHDLVHLLLRVHCFDLTRGACQ
jgi:hypothetical protein